VEIVIRGVPYSLDGLLPLTWGSLKEARRAGLVSAIPGDELAASDGLLLFVLRKVCPEASQEDVDALPGRVATEIINQAMGSPVPFGSSSPSATSSG